VSHTNGKTTYSDLNYNHICARIDVAEVLFDTCFCKHCQQLIKRGNEYIMLWYISYGVKNGDEKFINQNKTSAAPHPTD